jgi:beta-glucosidase
MTRLERPFEWIGHPGEQVAIADVSLGTVTDRTLVCHGKEGKP